MKNVFCFVFVLACAFGALNMSAQAALYADFDTGYTAGDMTGQNGWTGGMVATPPTPSPDGGNAMQGWNIRHALEETYSSGVIYASHHSWWNGDTTDGNNDAPNNWLSLSDDASGKRSHVGGRWSAGQPGLLGDDGQTLTSFSDEGWYFSEATIDVDNKTVTLDVTGPNGSTETVGPHTFASQWGGGQPDSIDTVNLFTGDGAYIDGVHIGREKVPEASTVALLGLGGLLAFVRSRRR